MASRIVSVILLAASVLALTMLHPGDTAGAAAPWSDATDSWWQQSYGVGEAEVATVADGYPDGAFRPSGPTTRAQFAKLAARGLYAAPGTTLYPFIEAAHAPYSQITRAQAFSILGRCLAEAELRSSGAVHGTVLSYGSLQQWFDREGRTFYLGGFEDVSQMAAEHRAPTAYLVYRRVVQGGDYRLRPNASLTRGQAVALVLRTARTLEELTVPPAAPEILAVYPGDPGGDATPLVTGRALPGCLVTIYDCPDGGRPTRVAGDTANSAGYFYANIVDPLAEGLHVLTATVQNELGLVSQPSAPVGYLVHTVACTDGPQIDRDTADQLQ